MWHLKDGQPGHPLSKGLRRIRVNALDFGEPSPSVSAGLEWVTIEPSDFAILGLPNETISLRWAGGNGGGRGGIRTPDLRLRRPVPYPG